jgi:hypothetical protein
MNVAIVGSTNDVTLLHRTAFLGFRGAGGTLYVGFANDEGQLTHHLGGMGNMAA